MTTDNIAVELQERSVLRKGLRKLRQEGQVPAVIHDHGKPSLHAQGDYMKLSRVFSQAGKHHPVQIKLGGKQHLALIKDVDFEPAKHQLRHVVFQAIKQNEKVTAEIPVILEGNEIPAEKKSLMVLAQLDTVEVEALPKDLPDSLKADATKLDDVGDHLTVADLIVPEGVTGLTDAEQSLAVVEMPKDQRAEANAAAESLAADAGTVSSDDASADDTASTDATEEE
jgi:large subunit ribosomal protein L25